ncbi:hypothetical protein Y015_02535 [Chlamydia muridarum str. Nigg CM972]|nr:hypothetical protein TAC_02535 [Chlamydia muridarum str. Nigg3 CMUT3-5]AHH23793.1 hypothetical protein Y015_02535 [Chlamydia muridarum str. Nigg CM972]
MSSKKYGKKQFILGIIKKKDNGLGAGEHLISILNIVYV